MKDVYPNIDELKGSKWDNKLRALKIRCKSGVHWFQLAWETSWHSLLLFKIQNWKLSLFSSKEFESLIDSIRGHKKLSFIAKVSQELQRVVTIMEDGTLFPTEQKIKLEGIDDDNIGSCQEPELLFLMKTCT